MSYVVVKSKCPDGVCLELYHETTRKLILKALPKKGQIGCKFSIVSPN